MCTSTAFYFFLRFREDLYYRLSVLEITLPALFDRKEDLPLLQRHFIEKFATQYNKPVRGMTRRAQALLGRHGWPGNVRELENVIGKACMTVEGSVIDVKDLPAYLRKAPVARAEDDESPLNGRRASSRQGAGAHGRRQEPTCRSTRDFKIDALQHPGQDRTGPESQLTTVGKPQRPRTETSPLVYCWSDNHGADLNLPSCVVSSFSTN